MISKSHLIKINLGVRLWKLPHQVTLDSLTEIHLCCTYHPFIQCLHGILCLRSFHHLRGIRGLRSTRYLSTIHCLLSVLLYTLSLPLFLTIAKLAPYKILIFPVAGFLIRCIHLLVSLLTRWAIFFRQLYLLLLLKRACILGVVWWLALWYLWW